jgi:hypothetical protein
MLRNAEPFTDHQVLNVYEPSTLVKVESAYMLQRETTQLLVKNT